MRWAAAPPVAARGARGHHVDGGSTGAAGNASAVVCTIGGGRGRARRHGRHRRDVDTSGGGSVDAAARAGPVPGIRRARRDARGIAAAR